MLISAWFQLHAIKCKYNCGKRKSLNCSCKKSLQRNSLLNYFKPQNTQQLIEHQNYFKVFNDQFTSADYVVTRSVIKKGTAHTPPPQTDAVHTTPLLSYVSVVCCLHFILFVNRNSATRWEERTVKRHVRCARKLVIHVLAALPIRLMVYTPIRKWFGYETSAGGWSLCYSIHTEHMTQI